MKRITLLLLPLLLALPAESQTYKFRRSVDGSPLVVAPPDLPPVAEAGADITIAFGSNILLDGSASADPEGGALTYAWAQVAGPAIPLFNPNQAALTVSTGGQLSAEQTPTQLTYQLTVTDPAGQTSSDTVVVSVEAPPACWASPGLTCEDGSMYVYGANFGSPLYTTQADLGLYSWNNGGTTGVTTGATSTANGTQNTDLLVGLSDAGAPYEAALACRALGPGWSLPSYGELLWLRTHLAANELGGFNMTGAYWAGFYWSSTEYAASSARYIRMNGGAEGASSKSTVMSVRCVKR
ncbi:MAG: hypothetical protein KC466_15555 [Myxococcales bacterium]|nr:hypothetical protein [Myxococcales bacterium]